MAEDKVSPDGYVERVRDETRRYIQSLLSENEKLRRIKVSLETEQRRFREEKMALQEQVLNLRQKISQYQQERGDLQQQLSAVEEENRAFSNQYVQVEEQNNVLANLYVASYRLHSAIDREEVLTALKEVIINILGSEEFAVYEQIPQGSDNYNLTLAFGAESTRLKAVDLHDGEVGSAIHDGSIYVAESLVAADESSKTPLVVIPLLLKQKVIGAIVIFSFLPQKTELNPADEQLFDLLASHAAVALYTSQMHTAEH